MEISKLERPLKPSQYYQTKYPKKRIILHHTAGGSAQSSIDWWNTYPDHVATAFIIDRDGKVYQNFDPNMWSYALGVQGATAIEQTSIQIELANWGPLRLDEGKDKWFAVASPRTEIPYENMIACPFRGYGYYEKYTAEQISSLVELLGYLVDQYKIPINNDKLEGFWEYNPKYVPSSLPEGIWSHTTVRKDKSDIFPQPSLIQAIYDKFIK